MDSVLESLKDVCLNVILDNFERFYGAFKLSPGGMLGKHFEFLGRAYSETLFHKLSSSGKLEEKYLEFLINPHLKQLNLVGFDENLMPALLNQLKVIENNVIFVRAGGLWNIEVEHYKQLISSVPKVEVIEINDVVYPEVLQEIGKRCPLLKVLKIINCRTGNDGLRSIFMNADGEYENKVHLEQFDLTSTIASSNAIAFVLSHAPSLKCLDHWDTTKVLYEKHKCDLENNCIENSQKYSLTSLSFPSWQKNIPDTLKICTALCPDVTSLSIDCLKNAEQLLLCARFLHLKDVKMNVHADPLSFDGITQFLKLRGKGLLNFHLENGHASAEAIIEHCPMLQSLKFCGVTFAPLNNEGNGLFSRAKLSNLETFSITCSSFSVKETADSVKLILSNAKNLNSVNFSCCEGLTEDFIHSLFEVGLLKVIELNLSSSDVTVAPVVDLLLHGSLRKLTVADCLNITDIDSSNILSYRSSEVLITTNIGDEDESFGFDFKENDNFYSYEYDLDVCNGYDFDYDQYYDFYNEDAGDNDYYNSEFSDQVYDDFSVFDKFVG